MLDIDEKINLSSRRILAEIKEKIAKLELMVYHIDDHCKHVTVRITKTSTKLLSIKDNKASKQAFRENSLISIDNDSSTKKQYHNDKCSQVCINIIFPRNPEYTILKEDYLMLPLLNKQPDHTHANNQISPKVQRSNPNPNDYYKKEYFEGCQVICQLDEASAAVEDNSEKPGDAENCFAVTGQTVSEKISKNYELNQETCFSNVSFVEPTERSTENKVIDKCFPSSTVQPNNLPATRTYVASSLLEDLDAKKMETEKNHHKSLFSSDSDSDDDVFKNVLTKKSSYNKPIKNVPVMEKKKNSVPTNKASTKKNVFDESDSESDLFSKQRKPTEATFCDETETATLQQRTLCGTKNKMGPKELECSTIHFVSNNLLKNRTRGPSNRRLPTVYTK